ncbi:hypothetical protein PCANC_27377 [Puccinia coronata f. sp. avenae]|uniref:Uncharacterized protein n=1 Tax=Puccinia coronata f. sp. avenae TaxID=200324 RepID=A0A2N5RVQ2_9BASI|nr:hypothetical protein PCANC_27377 [Puccinia coronata f. sp. avenae]
MSSSIPIILTSTPLTTLSPTNLTSFSDFALLECTINQAEPCNQALIWQLTPVLKILPPCSSRMILIGTLTEQVGTLTEKLDMVINKNGGYRE